MTLARPDQVRGRGGGGRGAGGRGLRDRGVGDRGASDVLALVLLAPAAIGLALLVVFLGRQVDARAQVHGAAESAAQAAALQRTPAAAERAARDAVAAVLVDADTCSRPVVGIDLSQFAPGGLVAVTVECSVGRRGLETLGAQEVRYSATATAAVDPFRSAGPGP